MASPLKVALGGVNEKELWKIKHSSLAFDNKIYLKSFLIQIFHLMLLAGLLCLAIETPWFHLNSRVLFLVNNSMEILETKSKNVLSTTNKTRRSLQKKLKKPKGWKSHNTISFKYLHMSSWLNSRGKNLNFPAWQNVVVCCVAPFWADRSSRPGADTPDKSEVGVFLN